MKVKVQLMNRHYVVLIIAILVMIATLCEAKDVNPTSDEIKQISYAVSGHLVNTAENHVNLIGIRGYSGGHASPNTPNKYDDTIIAWWTSNGAVVTAIFTNVTVDPGTGAKCIYVSGMCADICEGTHAYHLGVHNSNSIKDLTTLVPVGRVKVFRDKAPVNGQLDAGDLVAGDGSGLNFHYGGTTASVGGWSAGCQVFYGGPDGDLWISFKKQVLSKVKAKHTVGYAVLDSGTFYGILSCLRAGGKASTDCQYKPTLNNNCGVIPHADDCPRTSMNNVRTCLGEIDLSDAVSIKQCYSTFKCHHQMPSVIDRAVELWSHACDYTSIEACVSSGGGTACYSWSCPPLSCNIVTFKSCLESDIDTAPDSGYHCYADYGCDMMPCDMIRMTSCAATEFINGRNCSVWSGCRAIGKYGHSLHLQMQRTYDSNNVQMRVVASDFIDEVQYSGYYGDKWWPIASVTDDAPYYKYNHSFSHGGVRIIRAFGLTFKSDQSRVVAADYSVIAVGASRRDAYNETVITYTAIWGEVDVVPTNGTDFHDYDMENYLDAAVSQYPRAKISSIPQGDRVSHVTSSAYLHGQHRVLSVRFYISVIDVDGMTEYIKERVTQSPVWDQAEDFALVGIIWYDDYVPNTLDPQDELQRTVLDPRIVNMPLSALDDAREALCRVGNNTMKNGSVCSIVSRVDVCRQRKYKCAAENDGITRCDLLVYHEYTLSLCVPSSSSPWSPWSVHTEEDPIDENNANTVTTREDPEKQPFEYIILSVIALCSMALGATVVYLVMRTKKPQTKHEDVADMLEKERTFWKPVAGGQQE